MKKFQEKRNWRDIMQTRPMLILLGLLILAFSWSVLNILFRMQETSKNRKIEEEKITDLEKRKEKLVKDIASLNTERGVEDKIREKFGLIKDGEGMVVIVDEKKDTITEYSERKGGFWNFIKNLFK